MESTDQLLKDVLKKLPTKTDREKFLYLKQNDRALYVYKRHIVDKYNKDRDFQSLLNGLGIAMKATCSIEIWEKILNFTYMSIEDLLKGKYSPRIDIFDKILNNLGYKVDKTIVERERTEKSIHKLIKQKDSSRSQQRGFDKYFIYLNKFRKKREKQIRGDNNEEEK